MTIPVNEQTKIKAERLPTDPYVSTSPWDPLQEEKRKAQKKEEEERKKKIEARRKAQKQEAEERRKKIASMKGNTIWDSFNDVQVKKASSAQEVVYMGIATFRIDELNNSIVPYPELLQGCPTGMAPIDYVLNNAFPEKARQNYVVSNYIY